VGAYLRVSGPSGPLTSVYFKSSSQKIDSDDNVVTTFIIKNDSVPALWAGAGPLFSYEGGGFVVSVLRGTGVFLVVVFECCN
ncbi:hypothetical protein, partial [Escherichia coli]